MLRETIKSGEGEFIYALYLVLQQKTSIDRLVKSLRFGAVFIVLVALVVVAEGAFLFGMATALLGLGLSKVGHTFDAMDAIEATKRYERSRYESSIEDVDDLLPELSDPFFSFRHEAS